MDLKDKNIVITGGGQGLGLAMAIEFAKAGANLSLIDINENPLKEAVSQCEALGVKVTSYICNVSKEDEVIAVFDEIEKDHELIHGLINNAGILRDGFIKVKMGDSEADEFGRVAGVLMSI